MKKQLRMLKNCASGDPVSIGEKIHENFLQLQLVSFYFETIGNLNPGNEVNIFLAGIGADHKTQIVEDCFRRRIFEDELYFSAFYA